MLAVAFGLQNKFMDKLVSVIIPTYNSAKFIGMAVDSVLNQTYKKNEIIVVDDGSTDETALVLKKYIDSRVVRYFKKSNAGPASARNFGIQKSIGELVAFLDADDFWSPIKLEKQVELFSTNVGLVYANVSFFNENLVDDGGDDDYYYYSSILGNKFYRGSVYDKLLQNNFIPTSSVIILREAIISIGLFDERKIMISVEDYDMWLRISKKFSIDYYQEPLSSYRIHDNQISKKGRDTLRKLFFLYLKHKSIGMALLVFLRYIKYFVK